jgi:Flp pilus assembly pilin Flp
MPLRKRFAGRERSLRIPSLAAPKGIDVVSHLKAFLAGDGGTSVVEYALVAGIFALAMVTVMVLVGTAAVGELKYTQAGLNNRNGVTP